MSIEDRAKQFAPFSPLRGLHEALKQMERVVVPKAELSEERAEELNRVLLHIEKGDMVTAVYYSDGEYVKVTGKVARLNIDEKYLQVVETKIAFEDLYSLTK
ncbi:MAG: YolD-like family protein [Ruminococcaceae bacterium]|nr:YolD-like family protein [Oscillospiraceae bacterium]